MTRLDRYSELSDSALLAKTLKEHDLFYGDVMHLVARAIALDGQHTSGRSGYQKNSL